jgi:hypothetical protein
MGEYGNQNKQTIDITIADVGKLMATGCELDQSDACLAMLRSESYQ